MKLRSKLLMAAVSLLTVSVAATATSAYAWYAANRQVNASVTNVRVRSTETSITTKLVEYSSSSAATTSDSSFSVVSGTGNTTGSRYTIETSKTVSDISGIGNGTFYKPMIDATGTKVAGWEDGTGLTDNYYKFVLKFTGSGETKVGLYFSTSSTFTTSASLDVNSAVRLSAVVGTETSSQKFVMVPSDVTSHSYLSNGSETSGTLLSELATTTIDANKLIVQGKGNDLTTYSETANTFLGTIDPSSALESEKTVIVTFYLWVEGTATKLDSNELTTLESTLSASLDFYTVDYVAPAKGV